MKKQFRRIKRTALIVLTAVLLIAGAAVTMIVGYAADYCTVSIEYQYKNGESAYDTYIAVFDKDASVDVTITNPIISGYKAVTSENAPAATTRVHCKLTENLALKVYYVPDDVPYKVRYLLQNVYDDDYTETLTLDGSYYSKTGLTGTYPDELENIGDDSHFSGFTPSFHKPDFIAADGSTEFEIYFNRNYYLIDFDLNGGYGVDSVYAKYKSAYTIAEPSRKGYTFKGWVLANKNGDFIDENGNVLTDEQAAGAAKKFTGGTVPDHDTCYKAYWLADKSHYTIIYWIENAYDSEYTDVATQDIYKYADNRDVVTGDSLSIDDTNAIPDFFSYNLKPQKVERDANGEIVLDADLRPTYLTNAAGQPIDESGAVIDFPEMSPGEREELNGKDRYFEIDTEKSDMTARVSGDGTTRFNVYLKRKPITQRFFFARKTDNGKYEIPGWTRAFSSRSGTFDDHLSSRWTTPNREDTDWMELSDHIPVISSKYADKLQIKTYYSQPNAATYYYYELKTKYFANMRDNWLTDAFEPLLITKNKEYGIQDPDYARFGAWSVEWGTPYAKKSNKTVKGIYEKLDEQLLYTEEYLQESEANQYGADPLVLNYLSFWTNAKNKDWNKTNKIYNFTYHNYVEILPSEYNEDKTEWNGSGGYVDTVKVTYQVENDPTMPTKIKIYGLLPENIVETYDGAVEYTNPQKRDDEVKTLQTAAALEGFALLTDTEIAKSSLPRNPVCNWYAKDGFDEAHHADIKYFYRRRYYSLVFLNNNVKEDPHERTRNIYYQSTINSVGIRNNWVYFEPEYPDAQLRNYYVFEGWCFDEEHENTIPVVLDNSPPSNGRKHFNSTFKMPADDVTLYAKWSLVKENVSFYNDYEAYATGKDPVNSCVVDYNSKILTNDIPTTNHEANRPDLVPPSTGATFVGWYCENEHGETVRFEPEDIPVTRDLKLYAKWNSNQSANYRVEFVERGTNTAVADPQTGSAYVSSTKSFKAKTKDALYEAYRPQEDGKSWWPVTPSHSILMKPNTESGGYEPNTYTFEYFKKGEVWYKVRYLEKETSKELFPDKVAQTGDSLITEYALAKQGYIPEKMKLTLAPAASTKSDTDEAKAEELAMNTIVFFYSKNNTDALVRVEYMLQKAGGDPNNKQDYALHREERLRLPLDTAVDFERDIYGSEISAALINSHYILARNLTEVNDATYQGEPVIADGNQLVIKVYYQRDNYPYKVIYVDMDQERLHESDPEQYPDNGVLGYRIYSAASERRQMGDVVNIEYPSEITKDDVNYYPITDGPQTLTIYHESFTDSENPDPKVNVKKIYYEKERTVTIFYKVICEGAVEGDLMLSQNQEVLGKNDTVRGSKAIDNSPVEGRYTFLGWYRTPDVSEYPILTDHMQFTPEKPINNTTYYAIFEMNSAPYTLDYMYQGRRGANDGSYLGDDGQYDEKVYTVRKELCPDQWDENKKPLYSVLADNAPDIDDLYKDCVWTLDDKHVSFDRPTRTVTIRAVQKARTCSVEFFCGGEPFTVQRVKLNDLVKRNGAFVEAPESNNGNPFAYWSVKDSKTQKEIACCYDREFNLRVTADITVTACYTAEAQKLFVGDPAYTREQTTDANGTLTDKLYADFILSYMEKNGKLLNPKYDNAVTDSYKTGLIVEYDRNIMLTKQDAEGATLSDSEKVVYPNNDDKLSIADAKDLINKKPVSLEHQYICYAVANDKYNNHNRVDRVISFVNSETARHLVLRAYYYVWNTSTDDFEMTEPVYFYLYDIGNTVSNVQ